MDFSSAGPVKMSRDVAIRASGTWRSNDTPVGRFERRAIFGTGRLKPDRAPDPPSARRGERSRVLDKASAMRPSPGTPRRADEDASQVSERGRRRIHIARA